MDKKTIILLFGGIGYIFILYFFFSKSLIADSKYFYIVIFAVSLIIGLLFFIFSVISKINISNTVSPTSHNLNNVYSRINEILREMPTAEEFMWDYGKTTRIDTRTFDKNKFIGIIGNSSSYRRMLVIYSEQDDAIVRYSGDPSKAQEMDIFDNFKPTHKEPLSIFDRMNKKKRHIPTVIVNNARQNQEQEESTEEEDNNKQ